MQLKHPLAGLAFVALLGSTLDARATEFELGLRTGYGIPFGKPSDDDDGDMNEVIAGQVPLWLDLGARINEQFYLGGYVAYGIGILGSTLDDQCNDVGGVEVSCGTHDWRFGAQFQYHIGMTKRIHPWVGVGIGYELVGYSVTATQGSQERTLSVSAGGWEFVNMQAGLDVPLTDAIALGPFATFTVAQYDEASIDCSGDCGTFQSEDQSFEDKALHNWLLFGVRATFLFGGR